MVPGRRFFSIGSQNFVNRLVLLPSPQSRGRETASTPPRCREYRFSGVLTFLAGEPSRATVSFERRTLPSPPFFDLYQSTSTFVRWNIRYYWSSGPTTIMIGLYREPYFWASTSGLPRVIFVSPLPLPDSPSKSTPCHRGLVSFLGLSAFLRLLRRGTPPKFLFFVGKMPSSRTSGSVL